MQFQDSRDLTLTAASRRSVELYDSALELLAGYYVDPLAAIDRALAEDPDFVSGHCLRAAIGLLASERSGETLLRESVAAGARMEGVATDRERRHLAAATAWLDGYFHRAIELYGAIVLDYPRDLLALQVAHVGDFLLGQQRMLRDRVAHALPLWSRDTRGYGYVLGMLAFGMEETNLYDRAESIGCEALAMNARDPWAIHAVAHVYEMTGRIETGIEWLESRRADWSTDNGLAFHNHWHLALFELERGNAGAALRVFDEQVWPKPSRLALEMVDAASLLWRLHLRGVELGARTSSVADAWSDREYHGYLAFNDAHAALAFVADGRLSAARALVDELQRRAGEDGSNAVMTREVGLPLARAILAFGEERYGEVVDTLWRLRLSAHRFGGSNAQRDVIEQTLATAALRAGRVEQARAVASERRLLRPDSPWASMIQAAAVQRGMLSA